MKSLIWWVSLASAVIFGQGVSGPNSGLVKLVVFDTFGVVAPRAKVMLTSVVPGEKFSGVSGIGGEAVFERVPFGEYDLDIRLPGFRTRKERLNISQSALTFQIGLILGATHADLPAKLSGSVKPDVGGRPGLWVRLIAIYGSDLVENSIDHSGTFEIDGMAPGKYLLIVLQKDKVVATKPLDILGGKQSIEITLEP